ncbi:MAG: xanthine dehydrogenase family protein subunit M [Caldilineaceae bacterium SB0675_bin_29]|uniref:Xanthine dehydrogenase family protein subunit M n=1 Tax=Caldilineaceae bacterium SB0675_bin_29 TaxID=2605266 RepID=A0A6B1FWF7_9CHLR|nr:xanthine dehydrogenase family protein subunit M [Caldilineaceae bacterium SB0675_bin_29]
MKPAAFDYFAPGTVDEALGLLADYGGDAKPLAGGQSLVPTMNFRLAQPAVLVDLNGIEELFFIREEEGGLRCGAMTRQRSVERSALVQRISPLLHEAMPHIAHSQIRNRGTIGGSLAHADPAAELPVLAVALDARMYVRSVTDARWVSARDFYMGLFATAMLPEEMLVEVAFPTLPSGSGWAFDEVARQHGNYAMCGAAAVVGLDGRRVVERARLVFLSVGEGPVEAEQAAALLVGEQPNAEAIRAAAETAATQDIDPVGDIHAGPAFRRHLARVIAERVLTRACERAAGTEGQ